MVLRIWIFLLIFFSLNPRSPSIVKFEGSDKVLHFITYFFTTWLIYLYLRKSSKLALIFAFLFTMALGFSLEVGQYFVPGRTFSLLDILADAMGSFLFCLLLLLNPFSFQKKSFKNNSLQASREMRKV